ncbi:MAG TPA: site-specific integrase [Armatimonadota bacterium]|nr:site-specific integrase [Armatimonadota bacterium]
MTETTQSAEPILPQALSLNATKTAQIRLASGDHGHASLVHLASSPVAWVEGARGRDAMTDEQQQQQTGGALAVIAAETPAQIAEQWAALTPDDRKRRAAKALRDDDREALWSLAVAEFALRQRVSPGTLRIYRPLAHLFLSWCAENGIKPHRIDRDAARRYRVWLAARGLAPPTQNVRLQAAARVLDGLVWAGMAQGNPLVGPGIRARDPDRPQDKARAYSAEDVAAMLAEARPRERAIVLLGAHAGLRASEISAVTWADVDLPQRRLIVRDGKGGRTATVGLTAPCAEALAALRAEATGERVIPLCRNSIHEAVTALCVRAGVTPLGVHALRHACGTQLHRLTHDLMVVRRHLRHADPSTTAIYVHLGAEDYRAAVDALGAAT